MNPQHFLITYIGDVVNVNANRMKSLLRNIQRCLNHAFLLEQLKSYQGGKNLTQKQSRGTTTWKDILENPLRDIASWHTKRWRAVIQSLKSLLGEDHHFKKEELKSVGELSKVCSQIVLKWLYGLSTNLQEQSQNGLWLATGVWQYLFHTFITQMTTDTICMCATRLSIVDWVYFETQTLLATLRIQYQPRVESYVSLEPEHLSPLVGCARNKRQYPTVLQSLKSSRWMLDYEWMDYLLSKSGMR